LIDDAKRDVVVIDVDSKDVSSGMSCPPEVFVSVEFLEGAKKILSNDGMFVLNLVCRNKPLFEKVISTLKQVIHCFFLDFEFVLTTCRCLKECWCCVSQVKL
jgi:spermidine synthase